MMINFFSPNSALESIFRHPEQIITMDANFLIPPDRSRYAKRSFELSLFQQIWWKPIFNAFPNLAIHEAVYNELVMSSVKDFVDTLINGMPQRLKILRDSNLTANEKLMRDAIEQKIYPFTNYDPLLDNKDDRGEVKSLSYIAMKGLPYFASHDFNTIQLIEKAVEWSTGLDNVQVIKMYELIFYLYKTTSADKKALRMLYKYQYYLTSREKETNPEWSTFITAMETLYPISSLTSRSAQSD